MQTARTADSSPQAALVCSPVTWVSLFVSCLSFALPIPLFSISSSLFCKNRGVG